MTVNPKVLLNSCCKRSKQYVEKSADLFQWVLRNLFFRSIWNSRQSRPGPIWWPEDRIGSVVIASSRRNPERSISSQLRPETERWTRRIPRPRFGWSVRSLSKACRARHNSSGRGRRTSFWTVCSVWYRRRTNDICYSLVEVEFAMVELVWFDLSNPSNDVDRPLTKPFPRT